MMAGTRRGRLTADLPALIVRRAKRTTQERCGAPDTNWSLSAVDGSSWCGRQKGRAASSGACSQPPLELEHCPGRRVTVLRRRRRLVTFIPRPAAVVWLYAFGHRSSTRWCGQAGNRDPMAAQGQWRQWALSGSSSCSAGRSRSSHLCNGIRWTWIGVPDRPLSSTTSTEPPRAQSRVLHVIDL